MIILTSIDFPIFLASQAVLPEVVVPPIALGMLHQLALFQHGIFLHYPARSGVFGEVRGMHFNAIDQS